MSATEPVQEVLLGEAAATAAAAVFVSDDALRYVAANDAACELLGYERADLLALRVSDVVERPVGGLVDASRRITDGQTRHGTVNLRHRDGRTFPVQYVSCPATVAGLPLVLTLVW